LTNRREASSNPRRRRRRGVLAAVAGAEVELDAALAAGAFLDMRDERAPDAQAACV
jgi:hypothetical protein